MFGPKIEVSKNIVSTSFSQISIKVNGSLPILILEPMVDSSSVKGANSAGNNPIYGAPLPS